MRGSRASPFVLVALTLACPSRPAPSGTGAPSTSTSALGGTSPSIEAGVAGDAGDTGGAHASLAGELCAALHALPEARRAECCQQPPSLELTDECRRGLDASLALAAVALDAAEVHACVAALTSSYAGCDHVGPNHPALPASCVGVVHGRLPAKSACRSSLECLDGLHCRGLGPTSAGTCEPPGEDGRACGASFDVLATYAGQKALAQHRECSGACDGKKCIAAASAAPPAALDRPCPHGACVEGARCVSGRCIAPKPAGAPCDVDRECIGGCVKAPGSKSGACGMRCDLP